MKMLLNCCLLLPFVALAAPGQNQLESVYPPASLIPSPSTDFAAVLFANNSASLSQTGKLALEPLVSRWKYSPAYHFHLSGHADANGSANDNLVLSQQRALAVKTYLIDSGVPPNRIHAHAYGESRAAVNIREDEALVFDRRVAISVAPTPSKPWQMGR
ncbi:MAG: OmpA family protein [Pseudomonadota bacterium]